MLLYPSSTPQFVIVYPVTSGIGNNLAILAEAILMSDLTRRRLLGTFFLIYYFINQNLIII